MKRILAPLLTGMLTAAAGPAFADSITFYQDDNFRGRSITTERSMSNFARDGFNDRVHSAVVHEGRWEICVDADFAGSCGVLAPGAYPTLGAYAGRISSVRPVEGRNYGNRTDDRVRNRSARATLYEGPNLSGRAYRLDVTMPNLAPSGFNDRASSLHVESGYWIFCSDAEFRGECQTFGPGDYATLPVLNNVISSGRLISDAYPYAGRPDWRREAYVNTPTEPMRR
jgi:hypothetical protein